MSVSDHGKYPDDVAFACSTDVGVEFTWGFKMTKHAGEFTHRNDDAPVSVDMRVRVYPGTDAEGRGVVVDDYGENVGHAVDIGSTRIVGPARRWAVRLDAGTLVFADSADLA